jgi:hypothetical protein
LNRLQPGHQRTAFALGCNVKQFVERHGLNTIGFLTLTFAEHVVAVKEASRRFNNLARRVLKRYREWIAVLERQASKRLHFHLLVAVGFDIRSGFDFEKTKRGNYRSASAALRREWSFWRRKAPAHGFGRVELLPIRSTVEGIARYVGKYIAKHIGERIEEDKGARLVRYSKGTSRCSTRFAWNSVRGWLWRQKVGRTAERIGAVELEDFREHFGPRWAWALAQVIMCVPLHEYPSKEHARVDGRNVKSIPDDAKEVIFPKSKRIARVLDGEAGQVVYTE